MIPVHIRWMIERDIPEVMAIEWASFAAPWSEEDFRHSRRQRNTIGMVAERGEKVVGFMLYELHKNRLHISNFAVHPEWRRKKVGWQMVEKLKSKLASHRRTRITLEVRETNLAAQLFFASCDFLCTKTLREHYEGEDGYRFAYWLEVPAVLEEESV